MKSKIAIYTEVLRVNTNAGGSVVKMADHFHVFWAYILIFSYRQGIAKDVMNTIISHYTWAKTQIN